MSRVAIHKKDKKGKEVMLSWMPQIKSTGRPKFRAIAEALRADIGAGRLKPGDRLPAQRALAKELGVDLTTVTRAFNEAHRMGLIEASAGRGSFVRAQAFDRGGVAASGTPGIDLSMNMPPQPAEARLQERIREGITEILRSPGGLSYLHYQESAGTELDRAAGAHWLEPRIGAVQRDRVAVVSGAQAALYAIARVLLKPADVLCVPSLTYPGVRAVAERLRLRLMPVEMDMEGLVPDALDEACRNHRPKAIYCIPTVHNPTTATMSLKRREGLVEVARRHGVPIIEDDAYGALPYKPDTPLAALAPDITWHIATLSKCVTPALRTAYVVSPELAGILHLVAEIRAMTLMVAPLMAALASRWIQNGILNDITTAIRLESAARQAIARRILQGLTFQAHPEGHHLWLTLPDRWRQADLNLYARQSGLALVPSEAFAVASAPNAIRIALGAAQNRAALERGLSLLATVLSHGPSSLSSIV